MLFKTIIAGVSVATIYDAVNHLFGCNGSHTNHALISLGQFASPKRRNIELLLHNHILWWWWYPIKFYRQLKPQSTNDIEPIFDVLCFNIVPLIFLSTFYITKSTSLDENVRKWSHGKVDYQNPRINGGAFSWQQLIKEPYLAILLNTLKNIYHYLGC